jgi:predicted 3-demethylubiquinone-9 3-methyltransferase (glyoxalase superfamily)
MSKQKITPCLSFDFKAEEAVNFYTSVFKDSKITHLSYYDEINPGHKGEVIVIMFELNGQEIMALNTGPYFKFTEAVSLMVNCDTQEEIDYYWDKLSAGGEEVQCGWLKDKFGVFWQIAPSNIADLVAGGDQERTNRVMKAVTTMVKLDIAKINEAYNQK